MESTFISRLYVGVRNFAQGIQAGADVRAGKSGELIVASGHASYQEAVLQGNVYIMQTKSATVTATTDISPLPATTGRALVGVYNPSTSGKNLVMLKAGFSNISGTPGGCLYIDTLPGAGCDGSNKSTPINALSQIAAGSVAYGYAAAVPKNTTVMQMLRPLGGCAAIALGAGINSYDEFLDGSIIVPPGALLVVSAHAVGTTNILSLYISWEEVLI